VLVGVDNMELNWHHQEVKGIIIFEFLLKTILFFKVSNIDKLIGKHF
jgi:hypothetical protein